MLRRINWRQLGLAFLIFIFGLSLRLYHFNWDHDQHLHPDGRFLTMVTLALRWPHPLINYFSSQNSPLEPHNLGYHFFVYGPFPLVVTKGVAALLHWQTYRKITWAGRIMAAFLDSGLILLLYGLSRYWAAPLLYALMVLPLQLSHFYSVDPWLNFFSNASFLAFYFAFRYRRWFYWFLAGIFLGLALASKISAILTLVFVIFLFLLLWPSLGRRLWLYGVFWLLGLVLALFLAAPGYFQDGKINPAYLSSWQQLRLYDRPQAWYPPGVQWLHTQPWFFPAKNIFLWELGLPLSLFFLAAFFYFLPRWRRFPLLSLAFLWILFVFIFQGGQFAKNGRYFLPIYPAIALISGTYFEQYLSKKFVHFYARLLLFLFLASWSLLFLNIYRQPLSRLAASRWIYQHVPPGSYLSCEYWDDCLPLPLASFSPNCYHQQILDFFAPDTAGKWQHLEQQLARVDYLILSSNRLWRPISHAPERYPRSSHFYRQLFAGRLNFSLCQHFSNPPGLSFAHHRLFAINDQSAEEAFTVYDHPEVFIFCRRGKR